MKVKRQKTTKPFMLKTLSVAVALTLGSFAWADPVVITGQQTSVVLLDGGDSLEIRSGGSIKLDDAVRFDYNSVTLSGTNSSILIDGFIYGKNEWSIFLGSGSVLTGGLTVNGGIGPDPITDVPAGGVAEKGIRLEGAAINGRFVNNGTVNVRTETFHMEQGSYLGGGFLNTGTMLSQDNGIRIAGIIENGFVNEGTIFSGPCTIVAPTCDRKPNAIDNNVSGRIVGDFINAGSILAQGSALVLNGGGALTPLLDGSFINLGNIVSNRENTRINGIVNGSFINRGTIRSLDQKAVEFYTTTVTGDVINALGGIIDAKDQAIRLDRGIVEGSLINHGTLSSREAHTLDLVGRTSIRGYIVNTGTISTTKPGSNGIKIWSDDSFFSGITNVGTISGTAPVSGNRIDIDQSGALGTLNNYQGATGSGGFALSYNKRLPFFYNMIAYGDRYGQLAVAPGYRGSMAFGIFGGDAANGIAPSQLRSGTYQDVVTGVTQSAYSNTFTGGAAFGSYNGLAWMLRDATYRSGDATAWDLTTLNFGLDMAEPQRALLEQRQWAIRTGLEHDCKAFGQDDLCVWVQARGSGWGDAKETAGVVTVAKRVNDDVRVGGFVDMPLSANEVRGVQMKSRSPVLGLFAAYSAGQSGTGLQARAAVAYQNGKADITRDSLMDEAIQLTGSAKVVSHGASLRLGWGAELDKQVLVTPYVGMRSAQSKRGAYSDGAGAADSWSYAAYGERRTTGSLGLDFDVNRGQALSYRLGLGVDRDTIRTLDPFQATSSLLGELSYSNQPKSRATRVFGTAGVRYVIEPNRTLTLDLRANEMDFGNKLGYAVQVGYRMAF